MLKKLMYIFVLLPFIQSCEEQADLKLNSTIEEVRQEKQAINDTSEVFSSFLEKFNSDCEFQKERVQFPLKVISLIDFETNNYDTTFLSKAQYECLELTEPKSNIIDGRVNLKFNYLEKSTVIITLGVEDTGVHIRYEFNLVSNSWILTKIVDAST